MELDSLQQQVTGRLVCRPEDVEVRVKQDVHYYREAMLRCIEDYIIQYNQQHIIELDANLLPRDLFRVHTHLYICTSVSESMAKPLSRDYWFV